MRKTFKQSLIEEFSKFRILKKLIDDIQDRTKIEIKHIAGSFKSILASYLLLNLQKNILIVIADKLEADDIANDLAIIINENSIIKLTEPQKTVKNDLDKSQEHHGWLIEGLTRIISNNDPKIIITNPKAFNEKVPSPENLVKSKLLLKRGQNIKFDSLSQELLLNGFDKKEYVSVQGDIAIRGGIIDIYPVGWNNPLRLDFWGDELESIREFDTTSQRSIHEHDSVEFINSMYANSELGDVTVFDFLDPNTIIIKIEPERLIESLPERINSFININVNSLAKTDFIFKTEPQTGFHGSVKSLSRELIENYLNGAEVFITADGTSNRKRLQELIYNSVEDIVTGNEDPSFNDINPEILINSIHWNDVTFSQGFSIVESNIFIYTEHEVFDRVRSRIGKKISKNKLTIDELNALRPGDYIVHEDKGIGRFEGFQTVKMGGSMQDCVRLRFANEAVLFVHLNYLHKISKYSAQEGVVPRLTKLGSAEWVRKKATTKRKLKDIARDLIKLYAKRKLEPGYRFPRDTAWQKEFEASFIYEDTPDQITTTEEVKKDMELDSPMDRLVCGDVGFGKTEIAIRAAFKAVQAGKQVAILVPTTILAQQHYMSFKDRLSRYPVKVDVISRFRKASEQKQILENTENGRIDILIGTHRILSKDIKFKNLGLLVIDEEHRFGVGAKEKLRQMRVSIDTLTLTATPIPRTLNFSLMGARDLSVIETPPKNRIPVFTEISEWNNDIVVDAVENEVKRGGQVFFVSDKVEDLEKIMSDMKMLLPQLKFGLAHGQMKPAELETVMENFISGKFDVLIATKIIESGIDIPNANTMIINRAQNFGLAELYQLRGRVGRANKQAYCYLMIPQAKQLSQKALRRLQAVEEFTDLGSGFKLAMRDMEIRGAGNLLGAEQSGFIIDIGFEMFHKILDEAVNELKDEEFSDLFGKKEEEITFINEEVAIEIDSDALLPQDYVSNGTERFNYYRKLYDVKSNEKLEEIKQELIDRFGKLPPEAENLIFVVKLRISAISTGFVRVSIKEGRMVCEFPNEDNTKYYQLAFPLLIDYIHELESAKLNQNKNKLFLEVNLNSKDHAVEVLWKFKKTLELVA